MTQSLTDILSDLIIAQSSIIVIEDGAKAKTGDPDYLGREALYKYAKRALPAINEAIEYLNQLKTERNSTDGGETKDKKNTILRDNTEA